MTPFLLKAVNRNYTEQCLVQEEKQRALLQLQWKVMGESQQVDQEVNSKKVYALVKPGNCISLFC